MTIALQGPRSEVGTGFLVHSGTSVHGLVDLSRLAAGRTTDPGLDDALARIDDRSGETWLHLLGLCLELDPPASFDQLIEWVSAMEAMSFRRVLLGISAWSWRSIVGADTIEAAARGDGSAAQRLLSDDRYYGGAASAALPTVLGLDPGQTKNRFLEALEAYRAVSEVESLQGPLSALTAELEELAGENGWIDAIDQVSGYRYLPEPEARQVVVMPHLAGPGLILAQHDVSRLIAYGASPPPPIADLMVDFGKALSDPSRVRILSALAGKALQLGELVHVTELTRSTVHHHLRILRAAGLVSIEGNARAYRYQISGKGRRQALAALDGLLTPPGPERRLP